MSKNLKLSYALIFATIAISLAWNTLLSFFNGVGISFVAYLAILGALLVIVLTDQTTRKRIMDLFTIAVVFLALESIIYFVLEYRATNLELLSYELETGSTNILKGMIVYQNVIASLAFLFLAYAVFRLVCEIKGKKINFVEVLLGNQKPQKKERQPKELSNGSLDAKPQKNKLEDLDEDFVEEQIIEIEEPNQANDEQDNNNDLNENAEE